MGFAKTWLLPDTVLPALDKFRSAPF